VNSEGICLVLSAPSGGGKTTLIRGLMQQFSHLRHSISYTTRQPRSDSSDKEDYHFIDSTTFHQMIDRNEFLEWARVHDHFYGTSKKDLQNLLNDGFDVVLDIDVQGAIQLKDQLEGAVYIFVMPPSMKILSERLVNRKSETKESLERRLANARREIKEFSKYDYIVINDEIELAIEQLKSIVIAEHLNTARRAVHDKVWQCLKETNNE